MKILFRAYFHQTNFQKKVGRKFIRVRIRIRIRIRTFSKVGSGSGQKSSGSATLVKRIVRYVRIRLGVDDKRLDDILADGIRGQTLQENTVTKGRPAS
jgi:hypothetical protein